MKQELICLALNIKKEDIADFLKGEIDIDSSVEIKKFNASVEYERLAEADKETGFEMIKKITAFGKDETYLSDVPVLVCRTSDLQSTVKDMNLAFIGDVKGLDTNKLNSRFVVKHIIEKTNGTSEVYLNTSLLLVSTAIKCLNGVINESDILSRSPLYDITISYNGSGYTLTFKNKYYKEV